MLLVLVGIAATLWLMFQHIPSWYRPARPPPTEQERQRVIANFTNTYSSLSESLNRAHTPFTFKVTQNQLNSWLAARYDIDPLTREWFPDSITDPMVVLDAGGVRLAATYTDGDLRTIVSARLAVEVRPEGLLVRLDDVSGGSLSVPDAVVREVLTAYEREAASAFHEAGVKTPSGVPARLRDLLEGIILPNEGKFPPEGQRFRVLEAKLEDGTAELTLERLRGAGRRE